MSPKPASLSPPTLRRSRAAADRGAVALGQHRRMQPQLVQLDPQGLLVAPHVTELLGQAF